MIKNFLKYIEIKTKVTGVFAFLIAIAYLYYIKQPINWRLSGLFFGSMLIFDFTTTAINNYLDTKENNQPLQFKRSVALAIIIILLAISCALGLYLAYLTDIVVLIIGGICFLCGIFYTYGTIPISRLPLGEFFSGLFYGLFIPFIVLYINMPVGTYLSYGISLHEITVTVNIKHMLSLMLLSTLPFATTANIMLANNICDLEKDVAVGRYTLPYFLGAKSLRIFAGLYYITYIAIIVMVICGILPPLCLLSLLTIFFVQKNINEFTKNPDKEITFINSIKNYIIIMGINTLAIFMSAWL